MIRDDNGMRHGGNMIRQVSLFHTIFMEKIIPPFYIQT